MKINQYLSSEEIKKLTEPSNFHGWLAVSIDWFIIAVSLAACAFSKNPLVVLLAMILIGGRQLALAILVHECTHYSLFRNRNTNNFVGRWICGGPVWQSLNRYREHHLKHHHLAGSIEDPDYSLVSPFPITWKSFFRKLARDFSGITGMKRLYGLLLMDLGFITYTAAADPKPVDQKGRSFSKAFTEALPRLAPVVITNFILFYFCYFFENAWLYLVWAGSYLVFFSVFVRIRSMAEHACMQMDLDPMLSTRTTFANPVARLTVAPHFVNFHLEHHFLMKAPYFQLPRLNQILKNSGAYQKSKIANGYFEVIKLCLR